MARKSSTAEIIPIGRLHFLVASRSEEGYHVVDLEPVDEEWPKGGCSCRGFNVRKECSHVDAVLDYLRWLLDD